MNETNSEKIMMMKTMKKFTPQESLMKQMYDKSSTAQSLFGAFLAFEHLLIFFQLIRYYFDPQLLADDINVLYVSIFRNGFISLAAWAALFVLAFLVHPVGQIVSKRMHIMVMLILMIAGFPVVLYANRFSAPLFAFWYTVEHLRLAMKMIAFGSGVDREKYPTFGHYCYFLVAPTFIYRSRYPRHYTTNWNRVFLLIYCMLTQVAVIFGVCKYLLAPLVIKNMTLDSKLDDWLALQITFVPVYLVLEWIGAGFGLYHCWLNTFAEIMKFADRKFYGDWWNAKGLLEKFRTWNTVTSDWLYEYVYITMMGLTNRNHIISSVVTVLVSAVAHDYILSSVMYPIGFLPFFTIVMGTGMGIVSTAILSVTEKKGFSRMIPSFMLSMSAFIFTFIFYSHILNFLLFEWHCRFHNHHEGKLIANSSILRYLKPRWSC